MAGQDGEVIRQRGQSPEGGVQCWQDLEQLIANTVDEVTMQVAIDSGSCANVVPEEDLPKGVVIE